MRTVLDYNPAGKRMSDGHPTDVRFVLLRGYDWAKEDGTDGTFLRPYYPFSFRNVRRRMDPPTVRQRPFPFGSA